MDKFFKISERGSSVKMEIIGGLTTFFAMAYIVFVNPNQVAGEGANGWLAGAAAEAELMCRHSLDRFGILYLSPPYWRRLWVRC